jgi:hypothetical protein
MRPKSSSLVAALLLVGLTATGLLVFSSAQATAETSYHKLKKHLRTAEHNTGALLGTIFAEGEPDGNLEIDLFCADIEVGRSEHSHHPKANPPKSASAPAPSLKESTKAEPTKPAHPAK